MPAEDTALLDQRQRHLLLTAILVTAIAVTTGSVNFLVQNSQVQILTEPWEEGQVIPVYIVNYVAETLSLEDWIIL